MGIVFLNGEFMAAEAARISPFDRGFLFADGVYEVLPCYDGRPFRLDAHLERLERSLAALHISVPQTRLDWHALIAALVERNGGGDLSVYLQVTRGVAPKRDHAFPKEPLDPTLFATTSPLPRSAVDLQDAATGATVITASDIRWSRADIKSVSLLANVLLRQQAVEAGAQECLLVRDGHVLEGAASNVFLVKDGVLVTPPLSHYLLPGITRQVVIELALALDLPVIERDIAERELHHADEIWLAGSIRELVPVTVLDGRPVGNGDIGPLWRRLARAFLTLKNDFAAGVA
ncbi:MAG: D-amino acid aminotransferase [Pseudomonadota bacterium]